MMATAFAPQLRDIKPTLPVSPVSSVNMGFTQDGRSGSPVDATDRNGRSHRRSNSMENGSVGSGDPSHEGADGAQPESPGSDGPRKRRRSRKGLDKRFECPEEGCGKSYSRAEHLYRHQLNHNSKQTFHCEYPDCTRTFVRGDLLKRHMDRHSVKGSQLNRRDSMAHSAAAAAKGSISPEMSRSTSGFQSHHQHMPYHSATESNESPFSPIALGGAFPNGNTTHHSNESLTHRSSFQHPGTPGPHRAHSAGHDPSHGPSSHTTPYGNMSPVSNQTGFHGHGGTPQSPSYVAQHGVVPFNLPSSQYGGGQRDSSREAEGSYHASATVTTSTNAMDGSLPAHTRSTEMIMLDQMAMPGTVPVFGTEGMLSKSPYVGMPEDFMAYLFNSAHADGNASPMLIPGPFANYGALQSNQISVPYYSADGVAPGYFPTGPQQVMAVNNLLDENVPEATISEEKSQQIFDYIKDRFHENEEAPVDRQRDNIMDGDRRNDYHLLSKRMMQVYIRSYWWHFSDQIPILHKPTFSPDNTPNLLLLAMMTIGAACLDRTHGQKITKAGAKLSNFLAWHLRWEIFMDVNSRPPAKLWIFQAMILLELYEKMYSTRELHERAHIHHCTTITMMRRGRSLLGKSSLDSPPYNKDSANGSSSSSSGIAQTPDEWWNHWITNEATRRTAFAAFVIDSSHATMFGHSAVMVAHEMRLPLPCDESLWKATSSAEVGRIESNLMSRGIKPIAFLEGLKRTLSHQEVRTNSFGRTILMAGLLSVTWHMHQRDLQVNVLGGGVIQALGGRDKWRATLTRAYDSWKADFDDALQRSDAANDPYRFDGKKSDGRIVFESRTVLHHLAHMAMHADILDCQIFARAKRLLGRGIGPTELSNAQRRVKDFWAPSARARDATYYALKFLLSVLGEDGGGTPGHAGHPFQNQQHPERPYDAREDNLLNRPWVLYFAALVVWCYGYALEGACPTLVIPTSDEEKTRQMREYLARFGSITDPNELRSMKGLNQNTALLSVLKDSFENTRWELLLEASNLLNNCITLNTGGTIT